MGIVGDVRYALRTLAKSSAFTAVTVLSLALGVGANTAVYSLVDGVLLNLLPVKNPRELVQLKGAGRHYGSNTGINALSYPIYEDFRDKNQVFSGMLCRYQAAISVSDAGRNERAQGELVSGTYFRYWAWARPGAQRHPVRGAGLRLLARRDTAATPAWYPRDPGERS